MTHANPASPRIPDAERYQHKDTLVTSEAKAWLSEFHAQVEALRHLQSQGEVQPAEKPAEVPQKTTTTDEPERAEKRLAPWEVLVEQKQPHESVDRTARDEAAIGIIRSALSSNRSEFYLQPVVTLKGRKVKFYEGLTRLRDEQGHIIMPAAYLPLATRAGLTSEIDNLLLMRSIKVLKTFQKRKYDIGIFCNFSKHALQNLGFFLPFKEFIQNHQDLSNALIFEFSQEVLNTLDENALKNLGSLAGLGFRFSLDNINSLDINFHKLFLLGFRYLKVDGNILAKGEDNSGMNFVTVTLAEQTRRYGLQLIAQKLETKTMASDLYNYDIRLGQGYLYGKPRLIRSPDRPSQPKLAATG